ncbi:hypothetical protein KCU78_g1273, partial [Aureobasidium melanogenum]
MSSLPSSSPVPFQSSDIEGSPHEKQHSDATAPTSSIEETSARSELKRRRSPSISESESPSTLSHRVEYEQELRRLGIFTSPFGNNNINNNQDHTDDQLEQLLIDSSAVRHRLSISLGLLERTINSTKFSGHSPSYVVEVEKLYLELKQAAIMFENVALRMKELLNREDTSTPSESPVLETQLLDRRDVEHVDMNEFPWEDQKEEH